MTSKYQLKLNYFIHVCVYDKAIMKIETKFRGNRRTMQNLGFNWCPPHSARQTSTHSALWDRVAAEMDFPNSIFLLITTAFSLSLFWGCFFFFLSCTCFSVLFFFFDKCDALRTSMARDGAPGSVWLKH